MEKNQRACPVCGKALPETARSHAVHCSKKCYHRATYALRPEVLTTPCKYNPDAVMCNPNVHKCSTCGWNPSVEERRRKEIIGQ